MVVCYALKETCALGFRSSVSDLIDHPSGIITPYLRAALPMVDFSQIRYLSIDDRLTLRVRQYQLIFELIPVIKVLALTDGGVCCVAALCSSALLPSLEVLDLVQGDNEPPQDLTSIRDLVLERARDGRRLKRFCLLRMDFREGLDLIEEICQNIDVLEIRGIYTSTVPTSFYQSLPQDLCDGAHI
ncbi:hypothetical protein EW146_g265 [Bondarzewia mesenterica]|uniref:Uncharacterized protein n=1 Tax=Bondarzewia mesenterica TaxID=1095465 RepID=A0A4S4MDX4_9AGAM|nr:hypothetical protein EW146_g265 [Bondarzewia mesenterica]